MLQPFDNYKNKGVEYDYILSASVIVDGLNQESSSTITQLIKDEDFMKIYFPSIALGRVYTKFEYINNKLHFTFGISLVDAKEQVTSKELIQNIKDFIIALNKNIEQTPELKIKESDIKVEIISENKSVDNIDKVLVNESVLNFNRANDTQQLLLTSDGVVERYFNESLVGTMPFSKLGVIRESKSLLADGYTLIWTDRGTGNLQEATITNPNNDVSKISLDDDPEQIKQDLQQEIQDVEEIQTLKDELENKLDNLNEDITPEEYYLVVYTNTGKEYEPDVCVKGIDGTDYIIANDIGEANKYSKEEADKLVDIFNDPEVNGNKYILKAISVNDIANIKGLYENKQLNEDNEDDISDIFPSSEFTEKDLTKDEIKNINLYDVLSVEQINWLQDNIGTLEEIAENLKNILVDIDDSFDDEETVVSVDKYVENLHSALKGE